MKTLKHLLLILAIVLLCGITLKSNATHIDSIQLIIDRNQLVLPGESFDIGIITYQSNGKIKRTQGLGGGASFWWNYKVEVVNGVFNNGRVTVDENLMPSKGKYVRLKVYPKKNPELAVNTAIPLNYEVAVSYQPTNNFDKAPGSRIQGDIHAIFNNGSERLYSDIRDRKIDNLYSVSTIGGSWKNGKFEIDNNFMNIPGHYVQLVVQAERNPAVRDTFAFILDYRHDYDMTLVGFSGSNGFSGSGGFSGGEGQRGGFGQPGQDGEFGRPGPDISIWVDSYYDSIVGNELLYIFARNMENNQEYRYLVNTYGGSINFMTRGGSGGMGGDGGYGGDGGDGRDGEVRVEHHKVKEIHQKPEKRIVKKRVQKEIVTSNGPELVWVEVEEEETVMVDYEVWVDKEETIRGRGGNGGDGGWGGPGGLGGYGGPGGDVYLYFTKDALKYKHLVRVCSEGGSGGKHGNGGRGGRGGDGGEGNPRGDSGHHGKDGPEAIGWAESGYNGRVFISTTNDKLVN